MTAHQIGLMLLRTWSEDGSANPLRVDVRHTDDVTRGFLDALTLTEADVVIDAVRAFLAAGPVAPTPLGGLEQEARLLRRVTEAANATSETSVLFDRAVADIVSTMGWRSGRALDVVGTQRQPVRTGRDAPPVSEAALQACTTGQPEVSVWADHPPGDARGPLQGAVAMPVVVDDAVAAVLEFVTAAPVDDDAELVSLFAQLGRQLGSVVERERVRSALGERTAQLERSNEELQRFAYVASHDLQEPLRKIVGFSELLEARFADQIDGDGQEYLDYVVDGARRMQQLIKDLLAYSRAGRAEPAFAVVDLDALIPDVLEMLDWTLEDAGAHVIVARMPMVWGDAGQLAEVVTNLVTNAAKYGPDGGATIAIDAAPAKSGNAWEITVTDDGIGIDPRYDQQVFEVFRRLHSTAEYPGTGIGLAVARRFVLAHGGSIWVTPAEPAGSVFHFTVPAVPEETT